MFKELIQYRHLLFTLAWRDIKIRYKQSVMGFLWAIFMPMMIVCAGILVKKAFALLSGKPMELRDLATVSVKSLPWAFFVSAIRFSSNSLIGNINLVTKIYFPREVFPLSAILASLFDFTIAALTLSVILIMVKIGISIYILWLPVILICLILIIAALGMILSCANVFFRDVKYIVEVLLTFGIFFTPVFYEVKMFKKWENILLLNPIAGILEDINNVVVLHHPPDYPWFAYYATFAIFGFLISWYIFHQSESKFAENI